MEQHYLQSSYREKLIEHLFIGELLKYSWLHRGCRLEIARPEVDNSGYDLIAGESRQIRHIQLKASHLSARAAQQNVHTALAEKASGCIVWIYFNAETLELGPFMYFGDDLGRPLPDLSGFSIAKHTKANAEGVKAERPAIRRIPKGKFTVYNSVADLYEVLFGRL